MAKQLRMHLLPSPGSRCQAHASPCQNGAGWHCSSMGPGDYTSFSGKAGWVKVALGCPAVLLGMFKASRA